MKIYIKIIIVAIISLVTISCEDKLNIDPQQSFTETDAFNTPEKVSNILTGAYAQAGQAASYGGQITIIAELLANNNELSWNGTFTDPGEFNSKNINTENGFVAAFWLNAYDISNQTNIVLDNLDVYENTDLRNSTEGQAKFLRAVAYFDLVRFFAKHNNNRINAAELGVPIVRIPVYTLADVTYPSRDTIEEVYNFIIQDLQDAITLLPTGNDSLASSNAAKALLARIHLQIGDYEQAKNLSNEVILSANYSLMPTLNEVYNNEENSKEDIFAWQVTDSDGSNSMNTFWATTNFGGRPGNPDISIEDSFANIFDNGNDARFNFFYVDNGSKLASRKWFRGRANIPFIRLAEMHLIRAEATLQTATTLADIELVLSDINAIRNRAGITPVDDNIQISDVTQQYLSNLYNIIILERLKELAFEGHKLHDYKRWGFQIGVLPFDDDKLVLPIPERETSINDELDQNDGY